MARGGRRPWRSITGAHRHDSKPFLGLLDDIPPIHHPGACGRPIFRPAAVYADRAYGTLRNRLGLRPAAHRRSPGPPGMPHGSGLGKVRRVIERLLCWIGQARRLKIRYEKLPSLHRALHYLQLARICRIILQRGF